MKARKFIRTAVALTVVSLVAASCGSDDASSDSPATSTPTTAPSCATADLALKHAGKLTVATGEPAFLPWVADDDPTTGQGFEAALVYAVADKLGIAKDNVSWVRTGFDEAIAPGAKDYDFNVQQFSIDPERAAVVDFSEPYYDIQQAIVGRDGSDITKATTIADLKGAKLGAAIGTTSLAYIDDVIEPTTKAAVFDDNAAAKAAFDANQIDGIVFDLPTAYYITSVEIPDSKIVGVLPLAGAEPEQLGALFEKGSALVPCVDQAIVALKGDGTLAQLQQTWLNQGGDIPTLGK